MTNTLQVQAIRQGTVIDHIPAGQGIKILEHLHLLDSSVRVTVGFNLPSERQGQKDIIKVSGCRLSEEETGCLALFALGSTINVIDNYSVIDKFQMTLPKTLSGAFDCPNSNCISHSEPVSSLFYLSEKEEDVRLKCHYCEKSFSKSLMPGI